MRKTSRRYFHCTKKKNNVYGMYSTAFTLSFVLHLFVFISNYFNV